MKRFKISKTVSTKAWGDVDKGKLWQALKKGLDEGAAGVTEAVKEIYAVVTAAVNKELTLSDCKLPHHEIREDGTVVLNRSGVIAAAAALAGARSEPELTDTQKAAARTHLLRHYKELELDPPESLSGEMQVSVTARVTGEMAVEDIPVAPGVDLEALRDGDDDPLEVVVEIPPGKSKRGWDYLPRSIQDIVEVVAGEGLPGYTGHQDENNVDWEFRTPVTHWVGAVWKDGKGYFRGVIDKAASDLKRWIRAGVIKTVSIWGVAKLAFEGGETKVIGYSPISIDWTPPRRAGMPTRIVAMGEMDSTFAGEMDGSHEELHEELRAAAARKLGVDGERHWVYIERTYDDYALDGDNVILGRPVEVEEQRRYVPVEGENEEGTGEMDLKEAIVLLRTAIAKGEMSFEKLAGEMGVTKDQAARMFAGEQLTTLKGAAEDRDKLLKAVGVDKVEEAVAVIGEMGSVVKALFGDQKPEKPAEVAGEMAKAYAEERKAAWEKLIDETVKEKVSGEQAQVLVRRMLRVQEGATKEQIAGEIDNLLKDETLKSILDKEFVEQPAGTGGGSGGVGEKRTGTQVRRVAI